MDAILSIKGLRKTYADTEAVRGIDLEIKEGICFGLLGPNGAGKTTTIEMMEGISKPSGGEILYRGQAIDRAYAKKIGIQFQHTALQDYLTVRESLQLFSQLYDSTLPIDDLIQRCSLQEFVDRDNRKLSGGQRQRLLLAIALINDPQILFLDEPTTGLDPQARFNFWQLIREIKNQGKTIVLTTHYMDEAQQLCDEIAIMDKGKIIARDTPEALLGEHFDGVMIRLPRALESKALDSLPYRFNKTEEYLELMTTDLDQVLKNLLEKNISLQGLHVAPANLEDLFLKITGHTLRD